MAKFYKEQPQWGAGAASIPCPYSVSPRDLATLINVEDDRTFLRDYLR